MRKLAAAVSVALGVTALGSPAHAALVLCSSQNCAPTTENVLFNGQGTVTGTSLSAHTNQSNIGVVFTSDHTLQASGGQATLYNLGAQPLTGTTSFGLVGYNFSAFELNFPGIPGNPPPAEATSITFVILDKNGNTLTASAPYPTYPLDGAGENFFSGYTTDGDVISKVTWTLNPALAGVDSMKQLRLGGFVSTTPNVQGVPEPATWLSMILGFGLLGGFMRSRKRLDLAIA